METESHSKVSLDPLDAPPVYAPPVYVPGALYSPRIYWIRPTNIVLRVLQLVFTLVAFSIMADVLRDAYNDARAFQYLLAVSVIAFLYALAYLVISVASLRRRRDAILPTPLFQYVSFVTDQVLAYFLFSSGSAAATVINFSGICSGTNYCSRLTGCVTLVFLAFLAFAISSVHTGYHLVKCILKA